MYSEYHRQQEEAVRNAGPYPSHRFRGQGIVICAGGPRLFTCVWVLVRILRDVVRSTLPIQVWHRGAPEMDTLMRSLLEQRGAEIVDACGIDPQHAPPRGWALKPFAILHSPFQEVVFLDADNIPLVDPATLFDLPPYRETGAVFWPDLNPIPAESPIWEICRVPYRNEPSFESGQIVLDKACCWKPLRLTMHLNDRTDFYYRHLYGDKDTFHMAWRFFDQPFSMTPYPPRLIPDDRSDPLFYLSFVLEQRDFRGRTIFQHRNTPKFILLGRNPRYPGFRHEKESFDFLDELALLWSGRVSTLELPAPDKRRTDSSRWFHCVYVSSHEKLLELLPDQRIGQGSSPTERTWRMISEGGTSVLEMLGDDYLMCRLTKHEDGVWRGGWLRYERMPMELIPWP
jgi:hypothetical protein